MTDLRTYLAYLTLYENNFRVLHWKIAGPNFHTTHERYGAYYDKLGAMLDETAEQMITVGATPVAMTEALSLLDETETTAITVNPALEISPEVADTAAAHMFEQLRAMAAELASNTTFPPEVADVFMDHARYFRIEGTYKLGRCKVTPSTED